MKGASDKEPMDALGNQCTSQSSGPVNQLFGLLIQALLAAQCNITPESMWPNDYGTTAIEKGKYTLCAAVYTSTNIRIYM